MRRHPVSALLGGSITTVAAVWRQVLLGFVLGVIVYGAAGYVLGRSADVHLVTDAEPVRCAGTEIERIVDDVDDPQSPVTERIRLQPGLECQLRFWVANDGDDTVRVDRVVFPLLGTSAGSGLEAVNLTPWRGDGASWYGPTPPTDPEAGYAVDTSGLDAIWEVDDEIAPRTSLYYEVHVTFDPDDCQSEGGTFTFGGPRIFVDDAPIVDSGLRISVGGTEFTNC